MQIYIDRNRNAFQILIYELGEQNCIDAERLCTFNAVIAQQKRFAARWCKSANISVDRFDAGVFATEGSNHDGSVVDCAVLMRCALYTVPSHLIRNDLPFVYNGSWTTRRWTS